MKFFIFSLFSITMITAAALASAPPTRELPLTSDQTLSRVNRSPGILEPPSETPTGDQAYLYYGLTKELPSELEVESN